MAADSSTTKASGRVSWSISTSRSPRGGGAIFSRSCRQTSSP